MILSSVLLPHPLGPMRLTNSPGFAYRYTSWSTANGCPCWSIYLLTPSTRTLASPCTSAGASESTRFTAPLTRAAQNEKPPCLDGFVSSSRAPHPANLAEDTWPVNCDQDHYSSHPIVSKATFAAAV